MKHRPAQSFTRQQRSGYIGASEMAVVMDRHPFKTQYQLWLEKTGQTLDEQIDVEDPRAVGAAFEPYILGQYEAVTGRQTRRRLMTYRHPTLPFIAAHLDAETFGEAVNRVVEIKAISTRQKRGGEDDLDAWGEPGTGDVPVHIIDQVTMQMSLRNYWIADVAAMVNGRGFIPQVYTVEYSGTLARQLEEAAAEWWHKYMVPFHERGELVPPPRADLDDWLDQYPLSWSVSSRADARQYAVLHGQALENFQRIRDIRLIKRQLEVEEEALAVSVGEVVKDAEVLMDPCGKRLGTWKTQFRRGGLDRDQLVDMVESLLARSGSDSPFLRRRAEELVEACRKEGSISRPLLFSEARKKEAA